MEPLRNLLPIVLVGALAAAGVLARRPAPAGDRAPARSPAPVAGPHPGTASLPAFTLFGWVSPPADSTTPARYAELAGAGFNVTVLAWEDPGTVAPNLARLACSEPVGVRNLLLDNRLDDVHEGDPGSLAILDAIVASYRGHPAFLGWYLGDEPKEDRFPRLAEWFRLLRERDPSHPAWNNLMGRVVFPSRDAFLEHLRRYVREVRPAVLSTDHYDHLENGERGLFIENVALTALVARESGLPFWGIVLLTQHGPFREVDDGLLAWQVAQWLSYGARGIGYFTYWTPAPDPQVEWGDGMIRWGTGERTAHYERVRRLNLAVRPVGETLAGLAWLGTEHAGGTPAGGTAFAPDSLLAAVEGRATIGQFADPRGRPYLLVANRDSAQGRTLALEVMGEREAERFDGPAAPGGWSPWPSAPTSRGRRVELALPAGGFALLRLSGGCGALVNGGCRAALITSPEPAGVSVRLGARGVSGGATLAVLDASGRRVWARAVSGETPVVVWDGRGDDGERVRPGVYWARLEDARGSVVRRITWLGGR
jgi:hypothetical protein